MKRPGKLFSPALLHSVNTVVVKASWRCIICLFSKSLVKVSKWPIIIKSFCLSFFLNCFYCKFFQEKVIAPCCLQYEEFVISASKEFAYFLALSSAAAVRAIARACAGGRLRSCSCDPARIGPMNTDQRDTWERCSVDRGSDNLRYAVKLSKYDCKAVKFIAKKKDQLKCFEVPLNSSFIHWKLIIID